MAKRSLLLSIVAMTAVLTSASTPAYAFQARPAPGKLSLVGQPSITIDPLCNPSGSGKGWVKVRNEGATGSAAVPLALTATGFTSKSPARHLNATAVLTAVTDFGSDPPPDKDKDKEKAKTKTSLAPNEELWIRVEVSGVFEDGDWETMLKNESVDIGPIGVIRTTPPFNLSMDVPNADAPELTLVRCKPASFGLKNDDGESYTITWQYSVDGVTASSSGPAVSGRCYERDHDKKEQSPAAPAAGADAAHPGLQAGAVLVPGNSFTAISFLPPRRWFGSRFVGLFKDATGDGRLVIHRTDQRGCTMAKTFKVKTHLATDNGNKREAYSDIVVFLFLLAGGFFSVLLNLALPSQIRKSKLRTDLGELNERISNLSTRLASRVRVLAGLDERLLDERLRKLTWTSSDFAAQTKIVEEAIPLLEKRLGILESMGTTREKFERLRLHGLPPTTVLAMEEAFEEIMEFVKKVPPDVQKAQAKIDDLEKQLDAVGQNDDKFAAALGDRIKEIRADLSHTGVMDKGPTWKKLREHQHLHAAVAIVENADPKKILPRKYLEVDGAVFQLQMLKSYVVKADGLPEDDALRTRILDHKEELLTLLENSSGQGRYLASRLVLQIKEGKFKEDIETAVHSKQVRIHTQSLICSQFQPCVFKLEFLDPALDTATARENWICRWEFTHPLEPPLTEEGWEVTHYFKRADHYGFTVTVVPRSRDAQCDAGSKEGPVAGTEGLPVIDCRFLEKEKDNNPENTEMVIKVLAETRHRFSVVVWRTLFGEDRKKWEKFKESQPAPLAGLRFIAAQWKRSRTGSNRLWQTLWFFLALLVVLIGMIAGAKEQILKLDLIPALIAIFLVGFGADQIKNLLTKQNESSSPKSGGS